MASLKYYIAPVTKADLPTLANLFHSAKLPLSINRLIFNKWPNEELQIKLYTDTVEGAIADPDTVSFKAVDDSNRIIGYLVLSRRKLSKGEVVNQR